VEQSDVVKHTLDVLQRLELEYAIVGSFASIAYGEPRFTHDIDILIELPEARVAELCREFPPPDWYVSQEAAGEAVRRRAPFNVIHTTSGNKIDFIVSRDDEWCQLQFARRQVVGVLENVTGYAVHPEDVILGKLLYYQQGGSDKHLRDIASMLAISGNLIDQHRLSDWAERLGVRQLWQRVLEQADE
jgi:hypothetical protein